MTELMQRNSQGNRPAGNSPASDGSGPAPASKLAIYIGDSPSDFAPLLRSDLGIVVGQNKLLRQVANAHGVKMMPLTAGLSHPFLCLSVFCLCLWQFPTDLGLAGQGHSCAVSPQLLVITCHWGWGGRGRARHPC